MPCRSLCSRALQRGQEQTLDALSCLFFHCRCSTHDSNEAVQRGNANTPLITKPWARFLSYDSRGGDHIPFLLSICSRNLFQNNSIGRSTQLLNWSASAAKWRWQYLKHTVSAKYNSPKERPCSKIQLLPVDSSRRKTSQALETSCPLPLNSSCCVHWKYRSPFGTGLAGFAPRWWERGTKKML